MSCVIIAEIGENHMGNMNLAKKMIVEAKRCGVDIVKFQSYRYEDVVDTDPEKEWFKNVQLSDDAHYELKKCADENGIEFLSSPFSMNRAKLLFDMGLTAIKIASSEIANLPLLQYVNTRAKKVYLSTGMASLEDIDTAIKTLNNADICLMHCVSEYPVKLEDANLNVIKTLKSIFNLPAGYSDHTLGINASVIATAMGAEVIEKHFTLDKNMEGTDHILSADPRELKEMVDRIREVEKLCGSPIKKMTEGEKRNINLMRGRFKKDK